MPIAPAFLYLAAGLLGLVFGSFLNVCIVRLPNHESIVRPGSHCPKCGHAIRWYDNVPVLSYLILQGKCRDCGHEISPVYPLIEVLTAILWVLALQVWGPSPQFVKATLFGMLLLVLISTDLIDRKIPHSVTLFGMAAGILLSLWVPVDDRIFDWLFRLAGIELAGSLSSFTGAVTGALFGGGLLYGVAWLFTKFGDPEKEYLGYGDVMLLLMIGTFLGLPLTYLTILIGSLLGTVVALPLNFLIKRFRNYQWPYGSFLGLAGIFASLGGQALLESYLRWSRMG
ncbi:MAG TPA: prepilin peptidase [Terriglobia bacterium]|nr:prepilin peptidase [Terriglobia bacterium]